MPTLAQGITEAMGFQKINLNVIDIEKRINDARRYPAQYRGLVLGKIAMTIRKERMIHVCCECKRYLIDGEWIESIGLKISETRLPFEFVKLGIPPGQQTDGYCPVCYKEIMKEIKALREQQAIVEELEK